LAAIGCRTRLKTEASDVDAEAYLRQALARNREKSGAGLAIFVKKAKIANEMGAIAESLA